MVMKTSESCATQINGGTGDVMILTNNALVPPGESLPAWAAVGIVPGSTDVWSGGEDDKWSEIHQQKPHSKDQTGGIYNKGVFPSP